tara:strand:- start:33 stop:512 length:480 start_codon:yes stop_codon:yes gene_type:complete
MLKKNLNSKSSLYLIICLSFFILGCSPKNKETLIIEDPIIVPIKKNPISTEDNKEDNFDKLPKPSELKAFGKPNNNDPFSKVSSSKNKIKGLTLTGIIVFDAKQYALVEYKEKSGSLTKGDIGGKTTNLLPDGIKVKTIDLVNKQLTLIQDKEEIFISL